MPKCSTIITTFEDWFLKILWRYYYVTYVYGFIITFLKVQAAELKKV